MPALVLRFYPNGNIVDYVKREKLDDGTKLRLVRALGLVLIS